MADITPITVAYGDGIGPEIMQATMKVLKEAEASIQVEMIEIGQKLYEKKYTSGIAPDSWESINRTKVLFKAPITTPQGGGYKSLNVTLRKALGLYANVRPSIAYSPFVKTLHPALDLIIVRENEEDLYAGIEYRHTRNMRESIKLISRTGCEKIVRYAFEYAVKNSRKKVTCMSKDNIMKFSDGIFHQVFDEIAKEYPNIKNEHYIIDIGTARLATRPEIFDVIVTSNLFGDIISDVAADISGSVGLAGSANVGQNFAMFEAIHGSAPDIAGKNMANPSGLINAAVMMLIHIGQGKTAAIIENAWKKTLEDGVHTVDIFGDKSTKKVGTEEFADAVIKRLGQKPEKLKIANYDTPSSKDKKSYSFNIDMSEEKKLVGFDVFLDIKANSAHDVADKIKAVDNGDLVLQTIACMGLKLWPRDDRFQIESDHWCCRFMPNTPGNAKHDMVAKLLANLAKADIDFIKLENLYEFDGKRGYSLAQGE